jgi:hypothetical protein
MRMQPVTMKVAWLIAVGVFYARCVDLEGTCLCMLMCMCDAWYLACTRVSTAYGTARYHVLLDI